MIAILKPKRKEYPELISLINEADEIFFQIHSKKDAIEIGISNETVQNLIDGEKIRKYLVIKDDLEIVASASFRLKNDQTVWVSSLFVKKNKQSRGYGTTLLKKIEFWTKKQKAKVVVLEADKKAFWAVNFYLKNNYKIIKPVGLKKYPFDKVLDKAPVRGRYILGKEI